MPIMQTVPTFIFSDRVRKFGQNTDIDIGTEDIIRVPLSEDGYIHVEQKADIRIRATSSAANMSASGNFAGFLLNTNYRE